MALNVSLPLEETLIPNAIAEIAETGGTSFLQFQETLYRTWKRVGAACKFCSGPLDSDRCADFVYPYYGGDEGGPASEDDCYIVSNETCKHEFHSGCFYQAVREGAGMARCPVEGCNAKWFNHVTDLSRAYTINYLLKQLDEGDFSKKLFGVKKTTIINVYGLIESLVLAAYGLRRRQRSHNTPAVFQHGRHILERLIRSTAANFKPLEQVAIKHAIARLNDCAFWVLMDDPKKWKHHKELFPFVTEVVVHGMKLYTRGYQLLG